MFPWPPADVNRGEGVFKWTSLNRSPVLASSRGPWFDVRLWRLGLGVPGLMWEWVAVCTVRSKASWVNGHTGTSLWIDGMTDIHEWKHYLPAIPLAGGYDFGHSFFCNDNCQYSITCLEAKLYHLSTLLVFILWWMFFVWNKMFTWDFEWCSVRSICKTKVFLLKLFFLIGEKHTFELDSQDPPVNGTTVWNLMNTLCDYVCEESTVIRCSMGTFSNWFTLQ